MAGPETYDIMGSTFTADQLHHSLFFTGPWEDRELDVSRYEMMDVLEGPYSEAVALIKGFRRTDDWSPYDIVSGKHAGTNVDRHEGLKAYTEKTGFGRPDRLVIDTSVPEELLTKWVKNEDGLILSSADVEGGKLYIPDASGFIEEGKRLSAAGRSAVFINALTEDNLPRYGQILGEMTGRKIPGYEAGHELVQLWLSDEDWHKLVFDLFNAIAQPVNPDYVTAVRKQLISEGSMPDNTSPFSIYTYTPMQEDSTWVTHRNSDYQSGGYLKKSVGNTSKHEKEHGEAFRIVARELVDKYPSQMMIAFNHTVENFFMPGVSIDDFELHEEIMSWSGAFDVSDLYNIIVRNFNSIGLSEVDVEKLHPEAQEAHKALLKNMRKLRMGAYLFEADRENVRNGDKPQKTFIDPFNIYDEQLVEPHPRRKRLDELPTAA